MKRLLLFWMCVLGIQSLNAQEPAVASPEAQRRFHIGASYLYNVTGMKVTSFSAQSIWMGSDLGTITLDDDAIAALNDQRSDENFLNMLCVQAGAVLLDKPDGRWYIDGTLLLGIAALKSTTDLDLPTQNSMVAKSDLTNPLLGLSFNFRYNITSHWGISLLPDFMYAWGTAKNIADSINPQVSHFINDFKETFYLVNGRISLLASYSGKRYTIAAGPGFYQGYMHKTYTMNRTNPENSYEYFDELKTSLRSDSFIDGCLRVDWTFIDPLTLSLQVAAGKDLYINTGLRFNF